MSKKERWQFWGLGAAMLACFVMLTVRLVNLQVRGVNDDGEAYSTVAEQRMRKTIYERGSRGQILDVNGALLAYDRKIYNIEFYRDPSSNREGNGEYSKAIWEVIQLLRSEGKEVKFDFWLAQDENGEWYFETSTTNEGIQAAREKMFRSNFYVNSYDVSKIYDRLCYNYMIDEIDKDFPQSEKLTQEDKLQVLGVWQEMQMNAFNTVPIVLARDVSWSTVMEIETRLISLQGMSVSVENQRVYPKGTLACHILGYTGLMQTQSQIDEYLANGYQRNDMIGLDGVERSMEQWLTGNSALRRGQSLVEIDRTGRRIRTLEKTPPTDGNTVKLTIDVELQQLVETELAKIVNSIRDTQEGKLKDSNWLETNREILLDYETNDREIKLAQNGAIVVLDMKCRVLAMASFPNYDPNLFVIGMDEEQRARMFEEARKPLFNNAIRAADTPGSVFKMCTALAALSTGKLTLTEEISDGGKFTKYDQTNPPQCWVNQKQLYRHANQNVIQGIEHSCNYFFYEISSRLGDNGSGEDLYKFATKIGLTSKTNIDLPNEATSVVGSQLTLYDPTKPINGYAQSTWVPVQVKNELKKHLKMIGDMYNITYSDERMDTCIKALMDMAASTNQGEGQQEWVREIRRILMEEMGMSRTMVYRQVVVGDIVLLLNEIKWGGSATIQTGIGQGITMVTPVAMARYVATIANGGYVYDVQIIDSIVSPTGEVLNEFKEPVLANDLSDEIGPYLPAIKAGMKGVVDEGGTAQSYFQGWKYIEEICAKTGTAEKSELDVENNSWFVSFAPYEEPEIVVVVYVPYGLSGAMSSRAARNIIEYYLDSKIDAVDLILPAPNGLAQ